MHNFANVPDLAAMKRLPQPFRMIAVVQAMSTVKRFCLVPCHVNQSIGDHTGRSVMLAFLVAEEFGLSMEETLDLAKRMAFHDSHETITSDIPYPVKHMTSDLAEAISDAESDVEGVIFEGYQMPFRGCPILPKSRFLSCVVDMLDLVLFCANELAMHNIHHMEILRKGLKVLETYNEGYERIYQFNMFNQVNTVSAIYHMASDLLQKVDNALI